MMISGHNCDKYFVSFVSQNFVPDIFRANFSENRSILAF